MFKYECNYCGDPLCPEECAESKSEQKEWINSEEYEILIDKVELPIL